MQPLNFNLERLNEGLRQISAKMINQKNVRLIANQIYEFMNRKQQMFVEQIDDVLKEIEE